MKLTISQLQELDKRIAQGLISKRKHPTEDLWIYNYTPRCQFGKSWDEYTLMCRGLILDKEGTVIARPFGKFFNLDEYQGPLPEGEPTVYEKLDGSLGILYWVNDKPFLATRGSFESDQAKKGSEILQTLIGPHEVDRTKTYLVEILYPQNRIVVDYKGAEELILLAVIDTETGKEESLAEFCGPFSFTAEVPITMKAIKEVQKENSEGYVLKWPNGFRLKYKFDEYVRLHRILTGVNERRVWECLRSGEDLTEYLDRVPDEFYSWVKEKIDGLRKKFTDIEVTAKDAFLHIKAQGMERKEAAQWIMRGYKDVSGVIFKMLDGKDYKDLVWKLTKPEATLPFKIEI